MQKSEYDRKYPTFSKTYATLRIYHDKITPEEITQLLDILPTDCQLKNGKIKFNGWFLSSEKMVKSKDCREHIDIILNDVIPKKEVIQNLIKQGALIDMSCFWLSKNGQGGPTLSLDQCQKLAKLKIDIWFDF